MSVHSVHSRKRIGKVAPLNILLSFCITHTHTHTHHFALEPTQAHSRARPKIIIGGRLQRSIPSSETKLNEDKLNETATRQLTSRILGTYILDI